MMQGMDDAIPPTSGILAVLRPHVLGRVGEAYVAICVALAALWLLPADPTPSWPFFTLFLITLPGSLPMIALHYFGLGLIFAPDDFPLVARIVVFLMWVAMTTVQMVLVRSLIREVLARRVRVQETQGRA
jgi:hypothetical protein